MDRRSIITFIAVYGLATGIGFLSSTDAAEATTAPTDTSYIVQAESAEAAAQAVRSIGGHVDRHLIAISAVGATLADEEVAVLRANGQRFTVFEIRGHTDAGNTAI